MNRPLYATITLIMSGIFIASNLYTMIPLQKLITDTYDTTAQSSSLASFCFIMFYAAGLFVFGIWSDLADEKNILVYGMVSVSILTFLISFAGNYILFLVLRSLQGFAAAAFPPAAFSYVFRLFDVRTRTISIALINTGFLFAGIFGQVLSAFLAFRFSFEAVFYGFSLFYFICFLSLQAALTNVRKQTVRERKILTPILTCIRFPPLQKLYAISFFLLFTVLLFYGGIEMYVIQSDHHFSLSLQTFRLTGLLGMIPAFFTHVLQKKFGAFHLLTFSLVLMTIGLIPSSLSLNEASLIFSSIALIASTSLSIPMVILLVGEYGEKFRGRAISLYSFTLLAGAGAGSLLAAIIPFPLILIGSSVLFGGLTFLSIVMHRQELSGSV